MIEFEIPDYYKGVFKNPRVIRRTSSTMSVNKMADFMYATIATHSKILDTMTLGSTYTRKQNCRNSFWCIIEIHEEMIPSFEKISGVKLENPPKIQLNSGYDKDGVQIEP